MKKKKNFFQRLFSWSSTPAKYKRRATSFALMATTFASAFGAVKVLGIATPQYFDLFIGFVVFLCTAIATYCQQKITPEIPKAK